MARSDSRPARIEYPVVTIPQQFVALDHYCNGTTRITDNDKSIEWVGEIQPTAFSRVYTVRIEYRLSCKPICSVIEPSLEEIAKDKTIPHTYGNEPDTYGTVLCLYLPKVKKLNRVSEWQPTMFLADTIVPWASLWLLYFELWLMNGVWEGGGIEHNATDIVED